MSKTNDDQRLEARARRVARNVGLLVRKSRKRADVPNLTNHGKLALIDGEVGCLIAGEYYDLSPEDVLEICASRRS